jgi:predicted O-methyltransferase YrrM
VIWQLVSWWQWYWRAKGRYKIHSPRVSRFIKLVLEDSRWYYPFDRIERARAQLYEDRTLLYIEDHGAGNKQGDRTVSSIAKSALSPDWQCRLLYRLVIAYPHSQVLEMGTSLGISTAYLAKAAGEGQLLAMEGAPALANFAQQLHAGLQIGNVQWEVGPFQKTLAPLLSDLSRTIDLVYLDGHHQGDAVQNYIHQLLPYLSPGGILVVDDIRWSRDMYAAWCSLRQMDAFDTCLDLGWAGVLFKGNQSRVDEALIAWKWKPWQIGLLAS